MIKIIDNELYWTEYRIPIRNLWHMLLYAWNEVPFALPASMQGIEDAPTLDALLATVLMKLTQQRLRIGLGRDYRNERKLLHGVRGRVDFAESLKRHAFEHGTAYCEFQEYSINVPKNQIVRSTLTRLIQSGDFGPDRRAADALRHQLRWTTRLLSDVDLLEVDLETIHREQAARHDRDYRVMLAVCALIADRQMPMDAEGNRSMPSVEREALVLYRIYERFVANFYRIHLTGWEVTSQPLIGWHEKSANKYLPSMRPDLSMREKSSGRRITLDTKFTAESLKSTPWGGEGFDSTHLYQVYAYLKTQEHLSAGHAAAQGILLYPAVNDTHLSERIELQGHVLRIETVDLREDWGKIEERLLGIVD